MYWRRRKRSQLVDPETLLALVGTDDTSSEAQADSVALRDAFSRLAPKDRQLLAHRFLAGATNAEAAEALGLAPGSGGRLVGRALARLRRALEEPDWTPKNRET